MLENNNYRNIEENSNSSFLKFSPEFNINNSNIPESIRIINHDFDDEIKSKNISTKENNYRNFRNDLNISTIKHQSHGNGNLVSLMKTITNNTSTNQSQNIALNKRLFGDENQNIYESQINIYFRK